MGNESTIWNLPDYFTWTSISLNHKPPGDPNATIMDKGGGNTGTGGNSGGTSNSDTGGVSEFDISSLYPDYLINDTSAAFDDDLPLTSNSLFEDFLLNNITMSNITDTINVDNGAAIASKSGSSGDSYIDTNGIEMTVDATGGGTGVINDENQTTIYDQLKENLENVTLSSTVLNATTVIAQNETSVRVSDESGSNFMLLFEDFGEYFYNYNGTGFNESSINTLSSNCSLNNGTMCPGTQGKTNLYFSFFL